MTFRISRALAAFSMVLLAWCGTARAQDQAQEALIDELTSMLQLDSAMSQIITGMTAEIVKNVKSTNPKMPEKDAQVVASLFTDAMTGLIDDSLALNRKIMLKYYTEDDIRAMIAFYKTPTGQKSIRLMPQMTQEVIVGTQQMMIAKLPPILEALSKRLEAAGYKRLNLDEL